MQPAGLAVAGGLALLTLGMLVPILLRAGEAPRFGPADWSALRFTLTQATLSAVLSVGLAVPVARALARRRFRGRGALITLLGAPFILPVIVAVLGLLAVFGRAGIASVALSWAGLPPLRIYGLHGVVLAHVFFNLPLATRLILQAWLAIPGERFRLAAALDFGPREVWRHLERPMLREVVPGAFLVIFVICLTSFAVALTLGGGPRATTIELAIYQAFRFEFDLGRAALLALVQFGLCAGVAVLALRVSVPAGFGAGLDRAVHWPDASGGWQRGFDAAVLVLVSGFLLLPLAMVVARGAPGLLTLPEAVWMAAGRSLAVALAATAVTLVAALALAHAVVLAEPGRARWLEGAGMLPLAASPLVIGTGLFLILFPFVDPGALALPVTALVNAAMALPFALRALVPALRATEADYGRLADSLGLRGRARLRRLVLPRLRRPLGFGAGLAAALSMGDLGVVALFADPQGATLPLQIYRLMAAYRMAEAGAAALLLLILSLGLFWLFDRGGRVDAAA